MIGVGALMSLNIVTKSVCAVFAGPSAMCCAPEIVTVELPVKEDPGKSPTFPPAVPLIVVGPVFVIVVPANTAYVLVVPGVIVGLAAEVVVGNTKTASSVMLLMAVINFTFSLFFILVRFCFMLLGIGDR